CAPRLVHPRGSGRRRAEPAADGAPDRSPRPAPPHPPVAASLQQRGRHRGSPGGPIKLGVPRAPPLAGSRGSAPGLACLSERVVIHLVTSTAETSLSCR